MWKISDQNSKNLNKKYIVHRYHFTIITLLYQIKICLLFLVLFLLIQFFVYVSNSRSIRNIFQQQYVVSTVVLDDS